MELVRARLARREHDVNCLTTLDFDLAFYDLGTIFRRNVDSRKKLRRIEAMTVTGTVRKAKVVGRVRLELQRLRRECKICHAELNCLLFGPIGGGRLCARLGRAREK